MTDLLTVTDLTVRIDTSRGPITPVRDVSLSIPRGKMLGLVGESGSGKSVTAMTITRLLPRRSVHVAGGRIVFDGRELTELSDKALRAARGKEIATIFQEPMTALNPVLTVKDQVTEPLRVHLGMTRRQAADRAAELLDMVGIRNTARVLRDYPHRLSGGMRQRVMIAMAMSCEPKLLIADEPTTALDVTTQLQILELVMDLQSTHGTSVLLITHDLGVVAQTCDEVTVMHDGRVQETAPVEQLFETPQADYTKRLLSFLPSGRKRALQLTGPSSYDEAPVDDAPALLEVSDLVKVFSGRRRTEPVTAVDGVSFSVAAGKTLAIVGESGSGKSTTGRALLRLHEPTSGSVRFDGVDLLALSAEELRAMRSRLQIVFQDTYASLDPRWTIERTLAEPLRLHAELGSTGIHDRTVEVMELVGLEADHIKRFPHEFSGGQRQRIGIARALLLNPALVVCDEPVSALDVSVQAQVLELMKNLQERLGLTYVFISHDLSVVELIADEVLVMSRGKVVEQGTVDQVFAAPSHPYTKALLAAVPTADPRARLDRARRRELVEAGTKEALA
jgi:peptide/nickel transport system ATP-binding protein